MHDTRAALRRLKGGTQAYLELLVEVEPVIETAAIRSSAYVELYQALVAAASSTAPGTPASIARQLGPIVARDGRL